MIRIPLGRARCLVLELRARCRHDVLGICPRCYPTEARTRRNRRLSLAIAWLERLASIDPAINTTPQVRRIAQDALRGIAELP